MKKITKKFSLQTQIIFANTILLLISLILYFIYLSLISNTEVYLSNPTLFNILYWVVIMIVLMILSSLIIDKITLPAKEFIGYAKEFSQINFKEIEKEMTNSDFVKLAKAFDELQDELNHTIIKLTEKNNEITTLNTNLRNELLQKRNLVSAISHDIKTPLTVIAATISAIIDGIIPKENMQAELENILNEIDKTKKMLQDAINIYQIESEILENNFKEVSLIEIVNDAASDLSKLIAKHKHTISLNLASDIKFMADKDKISTAIKNLILNAIIHSPEASNIYINIINNKVNSVLEVINTGVTLSEVDLKNIFKPFYRVDKSRTKNDDFGNGLGLSITQQILAKHNLDINVENIDNGVKFYIIFKN